MFWQVPDITWIVEAALQANESNVTRQLPEHPRPLFSSRLPAASSPRALQGSFPMIHDQKVQ
jgi:hypothetical protein